MATPPVITHPADRAVVRVSILTISGHAVPHASICLLDWDQSIARTRADERGDWSVTLSDARDHDHVLRAELLDSGGRTIAISEPRVVYVAEEDHDAAQPHSTSSGFLPHLGKGRGLGSLLSRKRRTGTQEQASSVPRRDEAQYAAPAAGGTDGRWERAERVADRLEAGDSGPPIALERESVSTAPLEAAEEARPPGGRRDGLRAAPAQRGQGPAAESKSSARAVKQAGEALELEVHEVTTARPRVVEAELQDMRSTTSQDEPEPLTVVETKRVRPGRSIR